METIRNGILSGNGASEYGPRGTRSVFRGAPMGRHEGADSSYCTTHRGAKRDFALCPVGAPQGDVLMHSGWENSVNMPSVLSNTFTDPSQEYTLSFRKAHQGFCRPRGGHPQSHLTKSCLAPADTNETAEIFSRFCFRSGKAT